MSETKSVRHHVLVGLMLENSVDKIISGLVRRNFIVGRAGGLDSPTMLFVSEENNMALVLGLDLTKKVPAQMSELDSRALFLEELKSVIAESKIKYYMAVVADVGTAMTWQLGNVIKSPAVAPSPSDANPKSFN